MGGRGRGRGGAEPAAEEPETGARKQESDPDLVPRFLTRPTAEQAAKTDGRRSVGSTQVCLGVDGQLSRQALPQTHTKTGTGGSRTYSRSLQQNTKRQSGTSFVLWHESTFVLADS